MHQTGRHSLFTSLSLFVQNHCYKKCPVSRGLFSRPTPSKEVSPTCILTEFSPTTSLSGKRRHASPEDTFSPACAQIHYRKRTSTLTSQLLLQNERSLITADKNNDAFMADRLAKMDDHSSKPKDIEDSATPPPRLPGIRSYFEPSPL